jgi:IS5 family transposase
MKRRAAVEPTIGHLKSEHRLERNRLKGSVGDAINAILGAAAMNFQKLQGFFWHFYLHVLRQLIFPLFPITSFRLSP